MSKQYKAGREVGSSYQSETPTPHNQPIWKEEKEKIVGNEKKEQISST